MRTWTSLCRCVSVCRKWMAVALVVVTAVIAFERPAPAQGGAPAPAAKGYASAADVSALAAKLKSQRTASQALAAGTLLQLAPYNVNVEYRSAVANAAIHDTEAELFYVLDGSATIVTGGELVDAQRTNPQNSSGKAIKGGMSQRVSKGDFVMVPEGTPHWFSAIDGTVTLMSLHLPRQK